MKKLCLISFLVFLVTVFFYCDEIPLPNDPPDENRTYSISGNITSGEIPMASVSVRVDSRDDVIGETSTDLSGAYSFKDLPPGNYKIKPAFDEYTFSPFIKSITITDSDQTDVNFTALAIQEDDLIKLVFVGDINLNSKVQETVENVANGDFTFPFQHIGDYLKNFDLTFGNLESIISNKGKTTKPVTGVELRAAPDAVNGLLYAGFDIVSVANNHAGDFGEEGMVDCFNRLGSAGIDYAGGGNDYEDARKPVIKNVRGTRIAYLAYTNVPMYMDSFYLGRRPTSRWIATDKRPGIAWAHESRFENYGDIRDMRMDIAEAASKADIVIVSVHFGWEYKYEPDDSQKNLAHTAINEGASLVIGHHPHVVQPVEEYNGGFIAYSLGNFIFDISEDMAEGTTRGMIVEAIISDKKLLDVKIRYSKINEFYQAVPE